MVSDGSVEPEEGRVDEHERTRLGATFDLDAEGYDEGRPGYPDEVWDLVLGHLALRPGQRVLEIGPATGQATARLLQTGANVHAIEPGAGLADVLRRKHPSGRLTIDVATLESADLGEQQFDAVAAATSFHWVDPDLGLPILHRHLVAGAPLCLWWLVHRDPTVVTSDPVDQVVRGATALPNTRGLNGILDDLDLPRRLVDHGFTEVRSQVHRWRMTLSEDALLALFRSFSDFRKRDEADQTATLAALSRVAREQGGAVTRAVMCPILTARAPT